MSYHRGGHSGAVAVSYSTMSPLSPIRRYSGSAGSGTSVTSGTNGTSSSAYSNYRSTTPSNTGNERNGGYYTSATNVGHRNSSFSLSRPPDTLRRVGLSPARSVYNESSSIVGSSSISGSGLRYNSSSSSASSSAGSSSSSSASRERHSASAVSSITTAADLYALYSPSTYIPKISGFSSAKSSSTNGSTSSNWKYSSLASSSGVSSSLHGGDEYDSCRERRDRSYSSETTSSSSGGLCLPSTKNQNSVGTSNNERWKTRRSPAAGGTRSTSNSPTTGNANNTEATATIEDENSRPPRSRLQFRKDERYGLNGLRNIGNTCFMNSVIQCLSNTRPLLEYLLNEQHLQDINTTTSSMKGALIKAFGQVIQELWEMSGDHVVNTTSLKSQIQRFAPRFMGYSQQDAQEFLRYLLEGLHEDVNRVTVKPQPILTDIPDHYSDSHKASESWKRYLRSEDSTIVDVFVGQLRSSLLCTACDHSSVTLDPFWDLSLPIPMRLGTVKLNQCLEHFTKVETLDGDEKPTCSKCQMRRKCTKSFSIQKFPKILVIHLKRFSPTERFRGKLSVLVDFPLTGLDLSAFAAPGVQGCTYNLYGVANHSGTTYSGHYTAYCKHPYSGEWHEYNDSRVSSVPARSVVSSEAYVLFYEQQPPSPHL